MSILITGSTGFVGKNLVEFLSSSGFKIHCPNRDQLNKITIADLNEVDAIIHLAGKAHDLKKVSSSEEYFDVNYHLTKDIYDKFESSSVKKFIFISSVKAVADSIEVALKEDFIPQPKTDYGKSKLMAENYIINAPLKDNKKFYIMRPCMIHGAGNKGNLNQLYKAIKFGLPYPLASFDNRRSYLSIQNFCFVIKEFLLNDINSGIFNIADDLPISTVDVISILSLSSKFKLHLWHIPKKLIYFSGKVGDILGLPFNSESLQKLTESYVVNNDKLKRVIGKPLPLSSEEGLKTTASYFLNQSK